MPLYEYKCKKCGHRFERIQSFSAEDVKQCPVCQGEVERLISAPAIRFKGSGFYETDYGAKASAAAGSSSHGENSAPAEKPSSDGAKTTAEKPPAEKSAPAKAEAAASAPAKNS